VPSRLYSLSFAPNPDWSRRYSPQGEIWAYMRGVAEKHDVLRHCRYGHEMLASHWDEDAQRWEIQTSQGEFTADIVISGMGGLSEPSIPDLPGLETFEGTTFHSARWDHDHDLRGERVAVIGTGASAIQFVPQIQPKVGEVQLYQRTPPWLVPRMDRAISKTEKRLFKLFPPLMNVIRGWIYAANEAVVLGLVYRPRLMKLIERVATAHLHRQVKDPALRRKLKPTYRIGCKRILRADDYYPAVAKENVDVITSGIEEIRPHSIVTADGTEREVDTIIFGTGFHVTDIPIAQRLRGRDGRTLAEAWDGSPSAYKGAAVAGYPNLFFLVGPNTGLGHNSIVFMIESQIKYVAGALAAMRRRGVSIVDVRPEAQAAYNAEIDAMTEGTVWVSGGCSSYYIDRNGHNATIWPTFTWPFRQRTREFDEAAYALGTPAPAPVPATA